MELYIDELGEYIEINTKTFEKNHFKSNVRVCGGDGRTGKVLGTVSSGDLEGYNYIVIVQIGDAVFGFHPMSLLPALETSFVRPKQLVVDFDGLNTVEAA